MSLYHDYEHGRQDEGFNLPDSRYQFYATDGEMVQVVIQRNWYTNEETDETDFKVSFNIEKGDTVTRLPLGTGEGTAIEIAEKLYEKDWEATRSYYEAVREMEAELRMGA